MKKMEEKKSLIKWIDDNHFEVKTRTRTFLLKDVPAEDIMNVRASAKRMGNNSEGVFIKKLLAKMIVKPEGLSGNEEGILSELKFSEFSVLSKALEELMGFIGKVEKEDF
jgi:hypothetical protein